MTAPVPPELDVSQHLRTELPETTFGSYLEFNRKLRGLSRVGLSKITGISQSALAKYELAGRPGGKLPTLEKLAELCVALRIDPRYAVYYALGGGAGGPQGQTVEDQQRRFKEFIDSIETPYRPSVTLADVLALHKQELQNFIVVQLKESGFDQQDRSRSPENHEPRKLAPAPTGTSPKRSRKRKPKR